MKGADGKTVTDDKGKPVLDETKVVQKVRRTQVVGDLYNPATDRRNVNYNHANDGPPPPETRPEEGA